MSSNRGVAYIKRDEVQVESIDYPKFVDGTTGQARGEEVRHRCPTA